MIAFITAAIIRTTILFPGPSDIMETSGAYFWTVPQLLGMETRILEDGTPLLTYGFNGEPGWGSFESITLGSPIEAGIWAGGGWELDFESSIIPDSSYSSGIGLLENTSSRNRYSAFLRRPLPEDFTIDLSMARDDTVKNQEFRLGWMNLETGGRGWEDSENGYSLWTSWQPGGFLCRFSFAHLYQGGRQWELLGSLAADMGSGRLGAGMAGSISEGELVDLEGHARLEYPVSGLNIILRGDLTGDPDSLSPGGSAGITTRWKFLKFQIGVVSPPDSSTFLLGIIGGGPASILVCVDSSGVQGGLQTTLSTGHGFLSAGASLRADTLEFSGIVMPHLRWGENGSIHGGIAWELTDTPSDLYGTMDLRSMFTLGRFAFIFAVEDVLDDIRSYSFGVTWTFEDHPPRRPEDEEERDR